MAKYDKDMTKNRYEEIANKADEVARFMARLSFYGNEYQKVNKADRRKVSHQHLLELSKQTATQAMTAVIENMYHLIKEIKNDPSISPEQRFDLAWGEIELLLQSNVKWFAKRYDPTSFMGGITIEDMRNRYGMNIEGIEDEQKEIRG